MKIRLPADLKDQIETLAKEAGRSMNAEIIERLKATLDPENDPAVLRQKILEMQGDAALEAMYSSSAKTELITTKMLVVQLAKKCPPDLLLQDPALSQQIAEIAAREDELMREAISAAIESLRTVPEALDKRAKSGQLKIVEDTGQPSRFDKAVDRLRGVREKIAAMESKVTAPPKPEK